MNTEEIITTLDESTPEAVALERRSLNNLPVDLLLAKYVQATERERMLLDIYGDFHLLSFSRDTERKAVRSLLDAVRLTRAVATELIGN